MAFCNMCGAQIPDHTTVCAACSSRSAAAGSAGAGLTDNVAGLIAYITIIPAIIFLVIAPYNKSRFVRFSLLSVSFLRGGAAYSAYWSVLHRGCGAVDGSHHVSPEYADLAGGIRDLDYPAD